jgi:hypothetical protein
MEQLRAGELVQFDAVSADAGSLGSSAISRAREDRVLARFLPSSFFITATPTMDRTTARTTVIGTTGIGRITANQ